MFIFGGIGASGNRREELERSVAFEATNSTPLMKNGTLPWLCLHAVISMACVSYTHVVGVACISNFLHIVCTCVHVLYGVLYSMTPYCSGYGGNTIFELLYKNLRKPTFTIFLEFIWFKFGDVYPKIHAGESVGLYAVVSEEYNLRYTGAHATRQTFEDVSH